MTPQSDQDDEPDHGVHIVRTDPIARAVEVALYAPIGAAAFVAEMGPDVIRTVVARGRAEVDVRHEQVSGGWRHAKGAGEVAIAFGLPMLRKKVGERLASLRPEAPSPSPARRPAPAPRSASPATSNGHRPVETAAIETAAVDERLAIPGYDALSASQVVERLAGLSGDELAAVRQYETGHRRRRTILGKIEQLSV
jgi:hypothetical protein